jgi:hypothetical protein
VGSIKHRKEAKLNPDTVAGPRRGIVFYTNGKAEVEWDNWFGVKKFDVLDDIHSSWSFRVTLLYQLPTSHSCDLHILKLRHNINNRWVARRIRTQSLHSAQLCIWPIIYVTCLTIASRVPLVVSASHDGTKDIRIRTKDWSQLVVWGRI